MAKVVAITFDFDALSVWIGSYKATSASMVSRGEFGPIAVTRILSLLQRHSIRSTFFVPGHTALAYPEVVDQIVAEGHELAHHGYVHERITELTPEREEEVLVLGADILERHAGKRPIGYRSPSWEFTEHTADLLVKHGFRYDSSLMGSDFSPYWVRSGDRYPSDAPFEFGRPVSLLELPVSWLLDDFPNFEYVRGVLPTMKAPSQVYEIWSEEFRYFASDVASGCFTLTLHPQCIGRGHRLMMLDRLLEEMGRAGARFVTLAVAAESLRSALPAPGAE